MMSKDNKGLSRRDFLKTTGIATSALVGGGVLGSLITHNVTKGNVAGTDKNKAGGGEHVGEVFRGRMFFTNANEFTVLSEAVERIFPEDDLGPSTL